MTSAIVVNARAAKSIISGMYSNCINSTNACTNDASGMDIITSSPEITNISFNSLNAAICADGSSMACNPRNSSCDRDEWP